MTGWELLQSILRFMKHGADQRTKSLLKSAVITAAVLGKHESAPVNVVAQFLRVGEQRRCKAAADVEHRSLQQIFDRSGHRIENLPGEVEIPLLLGVTGQVCRVILVLIPVLFVSVSKFGQDDGPPTFCQKQQGKTSADVRIPFAVPGPNPVMG